MTFCAHCGKKINIATSFCGHCGKQIMRFKNSFAAYSIFAFVFIILLAGSLFLFFHKNKPISADAIQVLALPEASTINVAQTVQEIKAQEEKRKEGFHL
ncbi:zinc ribbon domain-containing protein, partial [Candidatus Woesearchaeota archaeon]|nr:zinc ribbon domain-containing protein [Candidatus Woesearchaeota archaeon]